MMMRGQPYDTKETGRFPPADTVGDYKVVGSADLFDGSREIGIAHEGALYRLKITRQGKLILNK